MSELNPIHGGKKSRVLEEKRKKEEWERNRRRREERERKQRKRKRRQAALACIFAFFIITGTVLIVVTVKDMMKSLKTKEKPNPSQEAETTIPDVVSNEMDLADIVIPESMYIYQNDEEMIQKLKDRIYSTENGDEKLEFIVAHQAAYPPEMIEFLVKYEEVVDFVLKYPIEINEQHSSVVDISGDYTKGAIPTFIQWDDRWGYIKYGDNVIGDSGCGPTCLAMAIVAITGRAQYTPITVCKFAQDNGYYVDGVGTAWDLMLGGVKKLGLNSEQISITEESIRLALREDKLVILSMGPGIFTYSGHFILVYKYEDGKFFVKDPNSRIRTDKGFTYAEIKDQIKGGWAIYEEEKK